MDQITRQISTFASTLSYESLHPTVIHAAKQHLVDTIACALGGRLCDAAQVGIRLGAGAAPARYAGRILSYPGRTTGEAASFANSAMIRYLDYNDSWPAKGHPSDILGGLLAVAESVNADGKAVLTAMVAAYEVFFRLGKSTQFRNKGWDQGFAAAICTSVGVCSMLRLPVETMAHAVAMSTVANVALRASRAGNLSHWKGAATAYAVRNGVFSAMLAAEGITGPDRPFEGRHGLWDQITGPFDLDPLPDAGGDFVIPTARFKFWPAEYSAQIAIFAAKELLTKWPVERIAEVDIATYWSAWHEIGSEPEKWDPKTRETADHSMPYIFARALRDGTVTVATFDEKAYLDPSLRPLMAKIKVHEEKALTELFPDTVPIRIDATSVDGEKCTIKLANPRGHEKNPMNDAETNEKFRTLAEPVIGVVKTKSAIDAWWGIDTAGSLSAALDLIEAPKEGA